MTEGLEGGVLHDVGYKKPPREKQWPKGTSGNPAGRKKGSRNIKIIFNKVANKLVSVKDVNGNTKKMTLMSYVVTSVLQKVASGNTKHALQALQWIANYSPPEPTEDELALGKISKTPDGRGAYRTIWNTDEGWKEIDRAVAEMRKWLNEPPPWETRRCRAETTDDRSEPLT
jgi:hypothetical protein